MILLLGIPSEPPLRRAMEAAEEAGIDYVVFNQREAQYCDVVLDVAEGRVSATLRVREQDWPLDAFEGVYVRLADVDALPENRPRGRRLPDPVAVERSRILHDVLDEWLEVTPCRVANRTGPSMANASKPFQAQMIARCGFTIPDTLITNHPDEVRAFAASLPSGRLVYKSISAVRSIVQELDLESTDLERLRYLPTQFQEYVDGVDVRVHVIGERILATEIHSSAIDYRYAARDGLEVVMTPCRLPAEIEARCISLATALDLPLCGIDLKRKPDGIYVCFEANPSPAYSYYEEMTGQPIGAALVQWLAGR
jgi:hypothetical protein